MVTRDVLKVRAILRTFKTSLVPINHEMHSRSCDFLYVTVQIEKASEGKSIQQNTELPKNTTELERSQCYIGGKILRSSSLNKNSVASITKCHPNVTQWSAQRSRSEPIILTNALIKQREEQLLMSLPTRKTFVDSL